MLTGQVPDPGTAKDFDTCLILHADHSFNASTFAGEKSFRPTLTSMLRWQPRSARSQENFTGGQTARS